MDLDFIELRMVVVTDAADQRDALDRAAGMAAVPIDVVRFGNAQADQACRRLSRDGADILFLDCDIPAATRGALATAARTAREQVFVILLGTPDIVDQDITVADFDADVVLEKPLDMQQASAAVERCVRARLPNRVLVVDGSATVRAIVRKIMRTSRFQLETEETDTASALALVGSGRFDIVFLDCKTPGAESFATLNEIKRHHPRVDTVMMTATRDQSLAERARKAGAGGFLFKPFFRNDMDAVLSTLFGLNPRRAVDA